MKGYVSVMLFFLVFQLPSIACKKAEKTRVIPDEKIAENPIIEPAAEQVAVDEALKESEDEKEPVTEEKVDELSENSEESAAELEVVKGTLGQYEKPYSKEKEKEVLDKMEDSQKSHVEENKVVETHDKEKPTESNPVVILEEVEEVEPVKPIEKKNDPFRDMHGEWAKLLSKYVTTDGVVNYKGIVNDASRLEGYLAVLANNPPTKEWSRDQKLAYWINAYNAFTIQLIVKNYPVKSITDLHNGKPWDEKWIRIGGKTYSLNQIENEIIRPRFNEPRIHFAVNCAAVSCPPLSNKAYTAENINTLLNEQTMSFLQNGAHNTITPGALSLSKIFEWYKEDFGDVASFVAGYTKSAIQPDAKVSYREYNWSLNGK